MENKNKNKITKRKKNPNSTRIFNSPVRPYVKNGKFDTRDPRCSIIAYIHFYKINERDIGRFDYFFCV